MRTLRPLLIASACALAATAHAETSMASSSKRVLGVAVTGAHADIAEAAREFIVNAGRAGHAELEAARLALTRSSDAGIRMFAQRMIDDHTWLNDRLRKIARANRLQIPLELSAKHRAKLRQLSAADGREFHRRYVNDFGVQAHRETIELFDKFAARLQTEDLKTFARDALPVLHAHLRMGWALQARFGRAPADTLQ
jgi:putative membrane protein